MNSNGKIAKIPLLLLFCKMFGKIDNMRKKAVKREEKNSRKPLKAIDKMLYG